MRPPPGLRLEVRLREWQVVPRGAFEPRLVAGPHPRHPDWAWHVTWGTRGLAYAGSPWPVGDCVQAAGWEMKPDGQGGKEIMLTGARGAVLPRPRRPRPSEAVMPAEDSPALKGEEVDEADGIRAGQVWIGTRDIVAGRTIRVTAVYADDRVTYDVLAKAPGRSRANARGGIRVKSLLTHYHLAEEWVPGQPPPPYRQSGDRARHSWDYLGFTHQTARYRECRICWTTESRTDTGPRRVSGRPGNSRWDTRLPGGQMVRDLPTCPGTPWVRAFAAAPYWVLYNPENGRPLLTITDAAIMREGRDADPDKPWPRLPGAAWDILPVED
jgi:hypothetical protein